MVPACVCACVSDYVCVCDGERAKERRVVPARVSVCACAVCACVRVSEQRDDTRCLHGNQTKQSTQTCSQAC